MKRVKKILIYLLVLFSFQYVKAFNVNVPSSVAPGSNFSVTVGGKFAIANVKISFNGQNVDYLIDHPDRVDDFYQSKTFTFKAPNQVGNYNINVILDQCFGDKTKKVETKNVPLKVAVRKVEAPKNRTQSKEAKTLNKSNENKEENLKLTIKINEEEYEVIGSVPYEGYELGKEKIGDKEVDVYKKDDKYLLKIKKDDKEYYALYDKEYYLVPFIDNKIIRDINKEIKASNIKKETITIDNIKVNALAVKDYKDIYLVSLLDEDKLYLYDAKTKRVSPFIKIKEEVKEVKKSKGVLSFIGIDTFKGFITVIVLLALLLIHFIIDIILVIKSKKKKAEN